MRALRSIALAVAGTLVAAAPLAVRTSNVLPSGWRLSAPLGPIARTGTMPQGVELSPDGSRLAVLDAGFNPPDLRIYDTSLHLLQTIPLRDGFGAPVWIGATRVAVAGGSTNAAEIVDLRRSAVTTLSGGDGSWPAAIAYDPVHRRIALADDGNGSVSLTSPAPGAAPRIVAVGAHPAAVLFSRDGRTLYAAVRGTDAVVAIDAATGAVRHRWNVGLHPAALALAHGVLDVALTDDDAVGRIDLRSGRLLPPISVKLDSGRAEGFGASPNDIAVAGSRTFVSLGGENAVALIRAGRVTERIPVQAYPTGVAVGHTGTLFVTNGHGYTAPANPGFVQSLGGKSPQYVARITTGTVEAIPQRAYAGATARLSATVAADVAPRWTAPPASQTVLRAGGPIKHVIYVIKENRTYDQILGDLPGGNGDPALAEFGENVTPNEHAIESRFGIFDNAYTNAQVSASGHNWTDEAFSNDYVSRFWPPNYAGRRAAYDFQEDDAPIRPHGGYLWDAAKRAHLTYRDYGEDLFLAPKSPFPLLINTMPGLTGHYDPRYMSWTFKVSDLQREAEWQREFDGFVTHHDLPQLEILWIPNDHTQGTLPGAPTPAAFIGTNDLAVGRLVQAVSHSPYWRSTAIFILEDDAQNGPDHVSDQRSTFYIASPYAKGGPQHAHYSTASFLRSIELILGLPPLSIVDATARPLYAAFTTRPINAAPYTAKQPKIDLHAVNAPHAFGAAQSARMDWARPDQADPLVLNEIVSRSPGLVRLPRSPRR